MDNIRKQAEELLAKMTLTEKVGQLVQCGNSIYNSDYTVGWEKLREGKIGSFLGIDDVKKANEVQKTAIEETRLGIPLLLGFDVIHGFKTIFPVPWSEAFSWDTKIAEEAARISAEEAAASGINWIYAPMIDVARDARWGRIVEGAGEDPYLIGEFAAARVKGIQSAKVDGGGSVAACAKHFVAYGAAEGGRDYNSVEMAPHTLYNTYLPPFKKAVQAGVDSIMTAFHDLNGEPCTGSRELLTDVLRGHIGFDGVVISDAGSTDQLKDHGIAKDYKDVAKIAITAGLDVEMCFGIFTYQDYMEELVKSGQVSENVLDDAVLRVLMLKIKLGLFENPYRDEENAKKSILTEEAKNASLFAAERSVVLLKNEGNVLPLKRNTKIAVIGPFADNKDEMVGAWAPAGVGRDAIAPLECIEECADVIYAKGCDFSSDDETGFDEAENAVKNSDCAVVFIGEPMNMNGEGKSRTRNVIPEIQERLLARIKRLGKPVVAVVIGGRPLVLTEIVKNADAVLFSGALGSMAGYAYMSVIFGEYNPSAKLVNTFPTTVGQAPLYYNHTNTGKPPVEEFFWTSKYMDCPIEPLYPFGFGLSYTNFEYGSMRVSKETVHIDDEIDVSVDVTNTGDFGGEEIVQLYVRDAHSSITRPVKELKGYRKVYIDAGETKNVVIQLKISDIGFYNKKVEYVIEPGEFTIFMGTNSRDVIEKKITVL